MQKMVFFFLCFGRVVGGEAGYVAWSGGNIFSLVFRLKSCIGAVGSWCRGFKLSNSMNSKL